MNPENQPPYAPPPVNPHHQPDGHNPVQQAQPLQQPEPTRSSHITNAPQVAPGHNYDPQIRAQYANEPKVVHASRNAQEQFTLSDEVVERHEESTRRYPFLNISAGEFVILDIKRHPIGLFAPLFAGGVVLIALIMALILYPADATSFGLPEFGVAILIAGLLMALVGIGTFIAVWVYLQNQFFLTNESVIQEIQSSLFARREQTVSLGSIEDASFQQTGILQTVFNYGTLRLSTEGDETTYRFSYVADPRSQVATVSNAIEAFKNGRPYDPNDDMN